jgi:hypothetical protein
MMMNEQSGILYITSLHDAFPFAGLSVWFLFEEMQVLANDFPHSTLTYGRSNAHVQLRAFV